MFWASAAVSPLAAWPRRIGISGSPTCVPVTVSCSLHGGVYLTLKSYSGFNITSCTHSISPSPTSGEQPKAQADGTIFLAWTMGASPHPLLVCAYASRSAGFDGALGNTKLDGSTENCFSCGAMQEPPGTSTLSWRHSFSVIGITQSLSFLKENI